MGANRKDVRPSCLLAGVVLGSALMMNGCASEGERLMREGASPAYARGYDDGCSSGKKAAGDMFSQFHKNVRLYKQDEEYRMGWNDGRQECLSERQGMQRNRALSLEAERVYDEHRRTEKMLDSDSMARDAMPVLSPEQLEELRRLEQ